MTRRGRFSSPGVALRMVLKRDGLFRDKKKGDGTSKDGLVRVAGITIGLTMLEVVICLEIG